MRPIRVLQLVFPGFGGIESFLFNHYQYMDTEKVRFDFLTQNRALKDAEQYRNIQYEVHLLPTTAAKNRDLFVRQVREIFGNHYDVLHLNNCFWTGFLLEELAREAGIRKVIVHSHSTFIDEPDAKRREELYRRHEEVKKAFSTELATDFWACSQMAADWLFGPQIPKDRIRIIKNAIEAEKYRFDEEKRAQVRKELNLEDALVLGTVGRLSFSKNHEFLIELLKEIRKSHPKVKLLIIGEGDLRGALETQIQENGLEDAVLLLGWKSNVEDYLQAMDIFLLPSRFEGLGIAAVEAAASGLPAVVSDQVPEDVAFTENVRHVPLELPLWTRTLEELAELSCNRGEGVEVVRAAGYDVRRQAKVLEALYQE